MAASADATCEVVFFMTIAAKLPDDCISAHYGVFGRLAKARPSSLG